MSSPHTAATGAMRARGLLAGGAAVALVFALLIGCFLAADTNTADLEALRAESFQAAEADRMQEAREKAQRSMVIAQQRFGPNHPEFARSLELVTVTSADPASYEPGIMRAVAIYEAAYGRNDDSIAEALLLLVQLKAFSADTEPLLKRALAIREAIHRPGDARIGKTLALLQGFYTIHNRVQEATEIGVRLKQSDK